MKSKKTRTLVAMAVGLLINACAFNDATALNFSISSFTLSMTSATNGFYTFYLTNLSTTNSIISMTMQLDDPALASLSPNSIASPVVWNSSLSGGSVIWLADGLLPSNFLAPGKTITGFRVDFVLNANTVAPTKVAFSSVYNNFTSQPGTFAAPEPGTLLLLGSGLLGAGLAGRFKKRKKGSKTSSNI